MLNLYRVFLYDISAPPRLVAESVKKPASREYERHDWEQDYFDFLVPSF
jgi:hypothetical protein